MILLVKRNHNNTYNISCSFATNFRCCVLVPNIKVTQTESIVKHSRKWNPVWLKYRKVDYSHAHLLWVCHRLYLAIVTIVEIIWSRIIQIHMFLLLFGVNKLQWSSSSYLQGAQESYGNVVTHNRARVLCIVSISTVINIIIVCISF